MSITTRLWSKEELRTIKDGTADKNLITIFMNVGSYTEDEVTYFPYNLRHIYVIRSIRLEPIEISAADDESALWFIKKEYPDLSYYTIQEKVITLRDLEVGDNDETN